MVTARGHHVVMNDSTVGIADLKAHLSAHLREVRGGKVLVVVDRGRPVARLSPADVGGSGLAIRRARRPLRGFAFGAGCGTTDSLAALREDRADR